MIIRHPFKGLKKIDGEISDMIRDGKILLPPVYTAIGNSPERNEEIKKNVKREYINFLKEKALTNE